MIYKNIPAIYRNTEMIIDNNFYKIPEFRIERYGIKASGYALIFEFNFINPYIKNIKNRIYFICTSLYRLIITGNNKTSINKNGVTILVIGANASLKANKE